MPRVEQIEAAIGEADTLALAPPFGKPLFQHAPIEQHLVLARGRRGREQAVAQFEIWTGDTAPREFRHLVPLTT